MAEISDTEEGRGGGKGGEGRKAGVQRGMRLLYRQRSETRTWYK